MKPDLTVVILTLNEERHLQRCINSVTSICTSIVVVDSYSTDRTIEIAAENDVYFRQNRFKNYATQFNWALENCDIGTRWIMRLDADEVVTPELANKIECGLGDCSDTLLGFTVNRMIEFLGQPIRHGGIYPARMLRIWRNGRGRCEDRWMDEHIIVDGEVAHFDGDIVDKNLNNLTWWTEKHNHYANREAIDLLRAKSGANSSREKRGLSRQARFKRGLKESVYSRLPGGFRSLGYFLMRYLFLLGFLDGRRGAAFHFLQGFWYRFLVDCKVSELEMLMEQRGLTLAQVAKEEFGYEI